MVSHGGLSCIRHPRSDHAECAKVGAGGVSPVMPLAICPSESPMRPLLRIETAVTKHLAVLMLVFAPAHVAIAQTSRATTDVPVKSVVLFSSGVGYFEHAGTVHGNSATELRFRTAQINDILKSITLRDEDGGRVGAIKYASQDPLSKTLKSFQVDITANPSLGDLLNQLRGAHVTVQTRAEKVAGTVLGVETRHRVAEKGEPVDVAVLNLLSGARIRAMELPSIVDFSLDDPALQDELSKALAALSQARDQDKKPVTIDFKGDGDRRVRIGYVVETPIWKTSYRLMLDRKGTGGSIQGWAIVENQTESDWNAVSLSLVSGRPLSFIMDLYQPLYATRPTVVPELFAGLRPQVYDAGIGNDIVREPEASPAAADGRIGFNAAGLRARVVMKAAAATGVGTSSSSVQSLASSGKLGELFQYTVGNVTLARQKSAMLPIITDSIDLERMSIYDASVLATNPLNGVRLHNTTGKHLLQGPVTVLDGDSYAGDARIDNVPPGQERFLSYGIDLDVIVNTGDLQTSVVSSAMINRGLLVLSRKLVTARSYTAENKATHDKVLVIVHRLNAGWKLVDTPKPLEATADAYRFKERLPAAKVTTLTVKEEMVQFERLAMLDADVTQLEVSVRGADISAPVRDAVTKAVQMKRASMDIDRQIASRTQQIAEITVEQARIRENMKTVAPASAYSERLLTKLNEQESSIEKLQKDRDDLTSRRDVLRRELSEYLDALSVS